MEEVNSGHGNVGRNTRVSSAIYDVDAHTTGDVTNVGSRSRSPTEDDDPLFVNR